MMKPCFLLAICLVVPGLVCGQGERPAPPPFESGGELDVDPVSPVSFETRNVGTTLEVEPTAGCNDCIIDLRFAPEIIFEGERAVFGERRDILGNVTVVAMPIFYSLKIHSALTMLDGHHYLAAVQSPKDDKGHVDRSRKLLLFVRCDIQAVMEEPELADPQGADGIPMRIWRSAPGEVFRSEGGDQ